MLASKIFWITSRLRENVMCNLSKKCIKKLKPLTWNNPIQDKNFQDCSYKLPRWNLLHMSYNDETWHSYLILLTFTESSKVVLINKHGCNFHNVTRIDSFRLSEIKIFWDIGYDIIIFVYDFTIQLLSRDSNLIVDMAMWQKFGKCRVSMKEVINFLKIWPEQVQFYMFNFIRI